RGHASHRGRSGAAEAGAAPGGHQRHPLDGQEVEAPAPPADVLAVHEALDRFQAVDAVVTLRYFAGLTVPQGAEALGISPAPRLGLRLRQAARGAEAGGRRPGPGVAAPGLRHFSGVIRAPIPHCPPEARGAVMAPDEKDVFVAALALTGAVEREGYLRAACAGHPGLLGRLRELLAAHGGPAGPRDRRPAPPGATAEAAPPEAAGTVIGPYQLLEPLGEGGMGVVWMARQQQPVKRLVALKLIKAGLDS